MLQRLPYLACLLALLWGCKVTTPVAGPGPAQKSADTLQTIDTITALKPAWLITQLGDTLPDLNQEVDLVARRLLPDSLVIAAVGDIMMGTWFPSPNYLPSGNGAYLWDHSRDILKQADITFGNLEGTILDGTGAAKECKNPDVCYLFKMPARLGFNLQEAGFDLLSLANNHANDFGTEGRLSTQRTLDSLRIVYAGALEQPYILTKVGHVRVGFVAFAPNRGTLTFYDQAYAASIVAHLDSLADLVIVSIHGGAEGPQSLHVTRKREFYFGEDRGNIYAFSHQMIDAGADLIFGHGPHVPRAMEVYKNRMIAYSLGNFCTYGRFNLNGKNGEAPILQVHTTVDGQFLSGQIHAFRQSKTLGPVADPAGAVIRTMKALSEEDFPESPVQIDETGLITYIQR